MDDLNNLLKKRNLKNFLKKRGINNVNEDSLKEISGIVFKYLDFLVSVSKEEMVINGRKVLKKKDVINAFDKIKKKEEIFEV